MNLINAFIDSKMDDDHNQKRNIICDDELHTCFHTYETCNSGKRICQWCPIKRKVCVLWSSERNIYCQKWSSMQPSLFKKKMQSVELQHERGKKRQLWSLYRQWWMLYSFWSRGLECDGCWGKLSLKHTFNEICHRITRDFERNLVFLMRLVAFMQPCKNKTGPYFF